MNYDEKVAKGAEALARTHGFDVVSEQDQRDARAVLTAIGEERDTAAEEGREAVLSFETLRTANVSRCVNGFKHTLDSWSPAEWTNALCGEAGEAANVAKKILRFRDGVAGNRGEDTDKALLVQKLGGELADVVIYADLCAAAIGLDLGALVVEVFNRKSDQIGAAERLPAPPAPEEGREAEAGPSSWNAWSRELAEGWQKMRNSVWSWTIEELLGARLIQAGDEAAQHALKVRSAPPAPEALRPEGGSSAAPLSSRVGPSDGANRAAPSPAPEEKALPLDEEGRLKAVIHHMTLMLADFGRHEPECCCAGSTNVPSDPPNCPDCECGLADAVSFGVNESGLPLEPPEPTPEEEARLHEIGKRAVDSVLKAHLPAPPPQGEEPR